MNQSNNKRIRIEILISIAGILGVILFLTLYDQAFPSASLDLELSRKEIEILAQETLQAYGYDLQDYEFALTFTQDRMASIYLQRLLGVPKTNQLIQTESIPIWYWHARWFRPLQKEEFKLNLSARGQVLGFMHIIPEDTPGADLNESQALTLAQDYLVQEHDLAASEWEKISASSEAKPGGRIDHFFEWKQRDFDIGEGQLRISVSVLGNQIGGFDYWLKVPEAFIRQFSVQSNRSDFFAGINIFIGMVLFGFVAIFIGYKSLIYHYRPRNRDFILIGIISGVALLAGLNTLALDKISYITTQDYSQFWLMQIVSNLFSALATASYIFFIWWGGIRLSKLVWQRQDKILPYRGNLMVNLAHSSWRGLMLGGLMGAYTVIFYLLATRLFGGWTPMDVDYSNLYATPFPFLGPILNGLQPAILEETLFRLVGIALIFGISRKRWLALLIPGLIWGFAHINYIREPYYLRGIELSISAIFLLGLFFQYFDLTTTIVGHMAYNATLGMLPLLRSGEPYFVFCGLVVAFFLISPILPGLFILIQSKLRGMPYEQDPPEISPAAQGDLKSLEALTLKKVDWEKVLNDRQAQVFCLKCAEQVVGVAYGRIQGDSGELEKVFVVKEWRFRYYGSQLVDAVIQELEKQDAQSIQACVPIRNFTSLAFLAGMGWTAKTQVFSSSSKPTIKTFWDRMDLRQPKIKDWLEKRKSGKTE